MTRYQDIRILIVDDDDISSFLFTKYVRDWSMTIHITAQKNGREALRFLSDPTQTKPHVIIVDLDMPVMGGFEFIEEFRKLHLSGYDPEIMIASSTLSLDDLRKASSLGVAFFSKPLLEKDIKAIISLLT
jgi:CheY-like chemotaxis protein